MNDINCEQVCMAAMALADGYRSDVPTDQIDAHLASCSECRGEVTHLEELARVVGGQKRRAHAADLWHSIAVQLPAGSQGRSASPRRAFTVLALALFGYKLVEMIPADRLGLYIKVAPVLVVIAVFAYLKENPFKINAALTLEGK